MNKRSLIKYSLAITASSFIPRKIIHADESIQNTMKKQNMTLDSIPITPNFIDFILVVKFIYPWFKNW